MLKGSSDDRPEWWAVPKPAGLAAKLDLPEPFFNRYKNPRNYDPGISLISAVNVALMLGQPLLLTGEPGSGKTRLAYWLAREMGLTEPLLYVVKSTTSGKDLLYTFDELARFRDAQPGAERRPQRDYLELSALGQAILFSAGPTGELVHDLGARSDPTGALRVHSDLFSAPFPPARRQVVLIDELDKAPRDTPNDLLSEIERMDFRIPELGVTVKGDPDNRPVVVITSNSDKSLPEPFLRRCVYHNIPPPNDQRRRDIVKLQNPTLLERGKLYEDAMATFDLLHEGIGRDGRRPGTAELLAWLDTVDRVYPEGSDTLRDNLQALGVTLKTLAKTAEDLTLIVRVLGLDQENLGLD